MVLDRLSTEYSEKRRFEAGTPDAPKSVIRFCLGTEDQCGLRGPTPTVACPTEAAWDPAALTPGDDERMHVVLEGSAGPKPTCAHRRPPTNFPTGYQIPATVRWRWTTSDETAWGRCGTGCCEPN